MDRRKFLIGAGGTAIGASALIGSGAFTNFTADRNASIVITADENGYLSIDRHDGPNGDYMVQHEDGTWGLYLNGESDPAGEGLNPESDYRIEDIFVLRNQGTQPVAVWLDAAGSAAAGKRLKWVNENGGGTDTGNGVGHGTRHPITEGTELAPGEHVDVGLDIQIRGRDPGDVLSEEMTVRADANPPDELTE